MLAKLKKGEIKGFDLPAVPARTPVPEPEARSFEQVPREVARIHPKKPSRMRRDERGERVAVYVPPHLAEELRVKCAKERRSVSDAVTEALARWLEP